MIFERIYAVPYIDSISKNATTQISFSLQPKVDIIIFI